MKNKGTRSAKPDVVQFHSALSGSSQDLTRTSKSGSKKVPLTGGNLEQDQAHVGHPPANRFLSEEDFKCNTESASCTWTGSSRL